MNQLKYKFMNFMRGRYGADALGRDMLWLSVGLMLLNLVIQNGILRFVPFVILLISYLRMFSKNITKRYNENRVYTNNKYKITKHFNKPLKSIKKGFKRILDLPKYKYIKCPSCAQTLRLPRGKKDITVTCPKCKSKFDART